MAIEGERALITGGADGLGFALAEKLLEKGAEVIICGRSAEKLEEASKKLNNAKLKTVVCDVSEPKSVAAMAASVGDVGILLNNAGAFLDGALESYSDEQISTVIDSNLKGLIFVTKAFLPKMQEKGSGFIVNISSTSGLNPRLEQSVYAASKYGVTGFTDTLRLDLKGSGVKVIGVYPGGMATKLFEKAESEIDSANFIPPSEVAEVVAFALERKAPMVMQHIEVVRENKK